jgi:hypothetical protein
LHFLPSKLLSKKVLLERSAVPALKPRSTRPAWATARPHLKKEKQLNKNKNWGKGGTEECSSVTKCSPNKLKAQGAIPSMANKQNLFPSLLLQTASFLLAAILESLL